MAGTFGGLSTALSALYAQRRGLEVTGQNIANVNTEGYSRQRVVMAAVGAPAQPAIFATGDPAGGGVEIQDVTRFRDEFLEARGRAERASSSYLDGQQNIYTRIEQVIGEPSDTGVQSELSEFWSAWHDVSNRPGDDAARSQLLERSSTLAQSLSNSHTGFASLWASTREQLDAYVTEINTTADTVAGLNQAVVRSQQAGLAGNELADQRDQAVLHLAELCGATSRPGADGSVDVTLYGSSLVSGADARHIEASGASQLVNQGAAPVTLQWTDTHSTASVHSGSVAATMETLTTTLPNITAQLDTVVGALITSVNTVHSNGIDLYGNIGGTYFNGTTAADIAVAITDPKAVAAAGPPIAPATTSLDGTNADAIADLGSQVGGADAMYRQYVVNVGVEAQTTYRRAEIQGAIRDNIDAARGAQSGVNLDEEMMNMLAYQRAYESAAKLMSVIDETISTLINSLQR